MDDPMKAWSEPHEEQAHIFALANTISAAIAKLTTKATAFCSGLRVPDEKQRTNAVTPKGEPFYSRYDLSWRSDDDLPLAR